jgi:hypothetical protein
MKDREPALAGVIPGRFSLRDLGRSHLLFGSQFPPLKNGQSRENKTF